MLLNGLFSFSFLSRKELFESLPDYFDDISLTKAIFRKYMTCFSYILKLYIKTLSATLP